MSGSDRKTVEPTMIDWVTDYYGGIFPVGVSRDCVTIGGQLMIVEEASRLPEIISRACHEAAQFRADTAEAPGTGDEHR